MKVLLVCKEMIAFERTAIMLLSSNLKKEGHQVKAAIMKIPSTSDSAQNNNNSAVPEIYDNVYKIVKDFRPELIGYSVMTGEHYEVLKLNKILKKNFNFISVMGGPHPTFNQQVIEEDGIDAICIGEGDYSFREFVRKIEKGEDYSSTKTFHIKYKGKIYRNPLGNLVPDLNELPFPDRQILYDADPNLAAVGAKSFVSARGCPFKCSYCFNRRYNDNYKGLGQILRVRSPELVIKEIEDVRARYPLDTVSFTDDVFTLRPQGWIKEFSKLYKKRISLPFNCMVRASTVKEQDIKDLKEAGLTHVWMGVECGDEKAANKIFMRNTSNDTIHKAAQCFNKYGVKILTFNIMGLPVDKPFEVDLRTLDLNLKIKPAVASFGLLYPFPGTAVAKMAIASGHFVEDKNTVYLESNKRSSMLTFKSKKEKMMVENLQKLAGIVVDFPFLRFIVPFLCSLPFTKFYHLLFYLHLGYCHKIRLSPIRFRNIIKELPIFFGYFKTLINKT
jgi:radical SAM superfamily enzyme YgiQ (UPF0313 family)